MLKIRKLSKKYQESVILSNLDLTVTAGEWVMIIGESGSGKSTLFKAIEDEIIYQGEILNQSHFMSISKQENDLFEECTVLENCLLYGAKNIDEKMLYKLINAFGLSDCLDQNCKTLSGGQKQRVSILRALLQMPDLLLLDEPTSQIDDESTHQIMQVLQEYTKFGTIIMITHDLSLCDYATKLVSLQHGKLTVLKNQPVSLLNENKNSKHHFRMFQLLKSDYFYHMKHYLNMTLMIALCMILFFISKNIGQHYANDLMGLLDNCYEARQVHFVLNEPVTTQELADLLNPYEIRQVNTTLELIDEQSTKFINGQEINAAFDETQLVLNQDVHFALSNSLAQSLSIKEGDTVKLGVYVTDGFETVKRYVIAGPADLNLPTYQLAEEEFVVGQIVPENKNIIYLDYQSSEKIKSHSQLASQFKTSYFAVAFENKESYKQAKEDLQPLCSMMRDLSTDIENTRSGLVGQFAPFRVISWVLIVVLVTTMVIILQSMKENMIKQARIFKQLKIPFYQFMFYLFARLAFSCIMTILIGGIGYIVSGRLMNSMFYPLDYTYLKPDIMQMVSDYRFEMISLDFSSFGLSLILMIVFIYVCLYIFQILQIKHGLKKQ